MAAGSAGEGAGSTNTELRWTFSRLACQDSQSELELASLANRTEIARLIFWQRANAIARLYIYHTAAH